MEGDEGEPALEGEGRLTGRKSFRGKKRHLQEGDTQGRVMAFTGGEEGSQGGKTTVAASLEKVGGRH